MKTKICVSLEMVREGLTYFQILLFLSIIIENEPSASIRPVQNQGSVEFEEDLKVEKFFSINCLERILS